MANETSEVKARLQGMNDRQLTVRQSIRVNDILNKLLQRLLAELPYLVLLAVVDGKFTQQEIDNIVNSVTRILRDTLREI